MVSKWPRSENCRLGKDLLYHFFIIIVFREEMHELVVRDEGVLSPLMESPTSIFHFRLALVLSSYTGIA